MGGGTEAFPDLGNHCQNRDCHHLDFLPFTCDGCEKVFCLEHRSYKSHDCPKSEDKSRRVVICEICSTSLETTGFDEESAKLMVEKHQKSGDCDPKKKKKKAVCPVRRCKEVLTFSNSSTCKVCHVKVCLKHRFPVEHSCNKASTAGLTGNGGRNDKFLVALGLRRNGKDCGGGRPTPPTSTTNPSVKAY